MLFKTVERYFSSSVAA